MLGGSGVGTCGKGVRVAGTCPSVVRWVDKGRCVLATAVHRDASYCIVIHTRMLLFVAGGWR